jgi:hypothetical protein
VGAAGVTEGSAASVARVCSLRSNVTGEAEAVTSSCAGSNPNIEMKNLQGVAGKPPSSNCPASSVTVLILSAPQIAVTAAPGIACPPERTTPLCVSAKANPAMKKNEPALRSIRESVLTLYDDERTESSAY